MVTLGTVGLAMIDAQKRLVQHTPKEWTAMRKVWEHIKRNPGVLSCQIGKQLGLPQSTVSSLVSQMENRGMLVSQKETDEQRKRRGGVKQSRLMQVSSELKGEYQFLPYLADRIPQSMRPTKTQNKPEKEPANEVSTAPKTKQVVKTNLDDLTVREAKQLYAELKKLFGE